MMQEVSCDDGNGESTFEFVDRKMEGISISEDCAGTKSNVQCLEASNKVTESPDDLKSKIPPAPSPLPNFSSSLPQPLQMNTDSLTPETSKFYPSMTSPNMAQNCSYTPSQYPSYQPSPTGNSVPLHGLYTSHGALSNVTPSNIQPLMSVGNSNVHVVQSQPETYGDTSTAVNMVTDVEMPLSMDNRNSLLGWIKDTVSGSDFLSKVAEKAKNSVDTMITTLDPQMKEYIYSGGDIDLIVASSKEVKVSPIREAFQTVFGRATVTGLDGETNIAAQPVGFLAGLKGAEERIQSVRQSGFLQEQKPIIAIENFIVEITSDRWFDMGCLVLQDPCNGLTLHMYTQPTPIPNEAVSQAQEETPADYPLRWSGLAITIGEIMSRRLQVPHTMWQETVTSISRRNMILNAAVALASQYKNILNSCT